MAGNIDKRTVAIEFDNKKFKEEIAETARSLRYFDDSLNNMGASSAAAGIDSINKRFSTLKTIGMIAFGNLTSDAIKFANKGLKSIIGISQSAGMSRAMKLEQAQFMLRGMHADVEAVMKDALAAVDGTAYGLDAAAGAAARFSSSGIKAGKQLQGALRGVAGTAAMTGSSFEEIADVFSEAAARGSITGNTLMRLNIRNLNAAAILGEAMGKTQEEIKEMTRAGEISFAQFAEIMDGAFGEHAQKANETYAGSLANVKAALGRVGAEFSVFKMEGLRRTFNALMPAINAVKAALKPVVFLYALLVSYSATKVENFIKALFGESPESALKFIARLRDFFEQLTQAAAAVVRSVIRIGTALVKAFRVVFPEDFLDSFTKAAKLIRAFTERLEVTESVAFKIGQVFQAPLTILKLLMVVFKGLVFAIGSVLAGLSAGVGGIFKFVNLLANTITWFGLFFIRSGMLQNIFVGLGKALGFVAFILGTVIKVIANVAWAVFAFVLFKILDIFKLIVIPISIVKDALVNLFRAGGPAAEALREAFDSVKAALSGLLPSMKTTSAQMNILGDVFSKVGQWIVDKMPDESAIANAFSAIGNFFVGLISLIGSVIPTMDDVGKAFSAVGSVFLKVYGVIASVFGFFWSILKAIGSVIATIFTAITSLTIPTSNIDAQFDGTATALEKFKNFMLGLVKGIKSAWDVISAFITTMMDTLTNIVSFKFLSKAGEAAERNLGKILLAGILVVLYKFADGIKSLSKLKDLKLVDMGFHDLELFDKSLAAKIKNVAKSILMVAVSMLILAASLWLISKIDPKRLGDSMKVMAAGFVGIITTILTMGASLRLAGTGGINIAAVGTAILMVAGAMLIMSSALVLLGKVKPETLQQGMSAIASIMTMIISLTVVMGTMNRGEGNIASIGAGILLIALAINLLVAPIALLGRMDVKTLRQGMITLAILFAEIAALGAAFKAFGPETFASVGAGMLLLAIGLSVLLIPIRSLGAMDTGALLQGFTAVIGLMSAFVLMGMAVKTIGPDTFTALGKSLIMMSVGMLIIAAAVTVLAGTDIVSMAAATIVLVVLMKTLAGISKELDNSLSGALALGLLATSILIMAAALLVLAGVPILSMIVSLGALIVLISVLTVAAIVLEESAMGAVALLAMAQALVMFAAALAILAQLSIGQIITALVALVAVIVVFVGISVALVGLGPILIAATASMLLFAGAALAIAASAMIFALAFKIITAVAKTGLNSLVDLLTVLVLFMPQLITSIAIGLVGMIQTFLQALPELISSIGIVISSVLDTLRTLGPEFMITAVVLIESFLAGFNRVAPLVVTTIGAFIITLMTEINKRMPDIVNLGVNILVSLINGLTSARSRIVNAVADMITSFLNAISDRIGDVVDAGFGLLKAFIGGITDNLKEMREDIKEFIKSLVALIVSFNSIIFAGGTTVLNKFLDGLGDFVASAVQRIRTFIVRMLTIISQNILQFINNFVDIAANFLHGIASAIRTGRDRINAGVKDIVMAVVEGLVAGFKRASGILKGVVSSLFEQIPEWARKILGINSPSKVMFEIGTFTMLGLAQGIQNERSPIKASKELADETISAFSKSLSGLYSVIDSMDSFEPTIAPVLDLGKVEKEASRLGDILSADKMEAKLSIENANVISTLNKGLTEAPHVPEQVSTTEITFEQTINSPEPLRIIDIYNATRSQIQMAKDELSIL